MMGNEAIRDREYQRDVMEVGAPPTDWPDDDPARCLGCLRIFGLRLEDAMRSRFDARYCVDCDEARGEMLDDMEDTPW